MMPVSWPKSLALVVAVASGAATSRANITFNFIPDAGTPQYVVEGFALAASRWSAVLGDDVTVNLSIGYAPLPAGVLGLTSDDFVQQDYAMVAAALKASSSSVDDNSAYGHLQNGPTYSRVINHTSDNPNGPNSPTAYTQSLTTVAVPRANAKALGLLGASGQADATIHMNSTMSYDFNPADGTTPGQYDFATVAAHEIGHALGFVSVVNQIEQSGETVAANQLPATLLDLFRFSGASLAAGPGYIDNTADTRSKYFSVDGGTSAVAQFASGALYGTGSQADHWLEYTWAGLMDPSSFPGLQRAISATDKRAFDVLGYRLSVPEPAAGTLLALGLLVWLGGRAGRRSR